MNGPPPGWPPGKKWHTREDSGLRLDRKLQWWHDGEPIEHPKIVEAFNRGLVPAEDGKFKLIIGNDWCFVEVEDSAYAVVAVDVAADSVQLRLSDRTGETLDPATLRLDADDALSCRVKRGRAKARFTRDAHYELAQRLSEEQGRWFLQLGDRRYPVDAAQP